MDQVFNGYEGFQSLAIFLVLGRCLPGESSHTMRTKSFLFPQIQDNPSHQTHAVKSLQHLPHINSLNGDQNNDQIPSLKMLLGLAARLNTVELCGGWYIKKSIPEILPVQNIAP